MDLTPNNRPMLGDQIESIISSCSIACSPMSYDRDASLSTNEFLVTTAVSSWICHTLVSLTEPQTSWPHRHSGTWCMIARATSANIYLFWRSILRINAIYTWWNWSNGFYPLDCSSIYQSDLCGRWRWSIFHSKYRVVEQIYTTGLGISFTRGMAVMEGLVIQHTGSYISFCRMVG